MRKFYVLVIGSFKGEQIVNRFFQRSLRLKLCAGQTTTSKRQREYENTPYQLQAIISSVFGYLLILMDHNPLTGLQLRA